MRTPSQTWRRRAATVCADAKWVTFGVAPSMAATGYGYIEVAAREDGVMDVVSFTEKPDEATAKTYISAGTYFWNSGLHGPCRHMP